MNNRFSAKASSEAVPADADPAARDYKTVLADFKLLSGDEIERLIGLCEAPALLWRDDPIQTRSPEPFGMIA